MIIARETIYAALFAQLQSALGATFKTMSRRWQSPDLISPADRPAFYQVETGEVAATSQKIAGLPLHWDAKVDLVIYSAGDTSPLTVPATELNNLIDAVEAALPNAAKGLAQTLGGKVYTARIDGKIEIVENVAGAMAMAVVPVTLIQGS